MVYIVIKKHFIELRSIAGFETNLQIFLNTRVIICGVK